MNLVESTTKENIEAAAEAAWVQQLATPLVKALVAQYTLPLVKKAWMLGFYKGAEVILQDVREFMRKP